MTALCGIIGPPRQATVACATNALKSLGPLDVYQRAVTSAVDGEAGSRD
jgi:hypothetical protein